MYTKGNSGRKTGEKCADFAYRATLLLTMVAVALILIGALGFTKEKVFADIFPVPMRLAFTLVLSAMIFLFIILLYRMLDRMNARQLRLISIVLFGIMLLVFAAILWGFKTVAGSDAMNLQDMAIYFAKTGDKPISKASPHFGYFGRYANNYFLTILLKYYFGFFMAIGIDDMYYPMIALSAAGIMLAAFFAWLTGIKLKGLCTGTKILVLCVMNPLYYVLVLWVYTNVLSIPFMMATVYFAVCAYQAKSGRGQCIAGALAAISVTLGYYIRPTTAIPVIAALICAFFWIVKSRANLSHVLRCAALFAVVVFLLAKTVTALNMSYFEPVSEKNFPIVHWLNMGSHGTGGHNQADDRFIGQFATKSEKSDAALKKMIEHYKAYSLPGLASFFYKKMATVWGYGNSGGMLTEIMQDRKMTSLYSWVVGDHMDFLRSYCFAFRIVTLVLMLVAMGNLLKRKEIHPYQFLFVLSFLGAVLFYCFWEAKNSYSLPFVYIMLFIEMYGAEIVAGGSFFAANQEPQGHIRPVMISTLFFAVGIFLLTFRYMTAVPVAHQDWTIRCREGMSQKKINMKSDHQEIVQEFYASKPFNTLELSGEADDVAVEEGVACQLTLLDPNETKIYETYISAADLAEHKYIILRTGVIVPKGRGKYTIKINIDRSGTGKLIFRRRSGSYLDSYDGMLTVNGKENKNDLFLCVMNEYEGPWCSRRTAALIVATLILATAGLCLWMQKEKAG